MEAEFFWWEEGREPKSDLWAGPFVAVIEMHEESQAMDKEGIGERLKAANWALVGQCLELLLKAVLERLKAHAAGFQANSNHSRPYDAGIASCILDRLERLATSTGTDSDGGGQVVNFIHRQKLERPGPAKEVRVGNPAEETET